MPGFTEQLHFVFHKWIKEMTVETIAAQFATAGTIGKVQVHGGGHINDSYHLVNTTNGAPDYLLQRVNHHVFKDVPLLMQNTVLVCDHVAAKIRKDFYTNSPKYFGFFVYLWINQNYLKNSSPGLINFGVLTVRIRRI